MALSRLAGSLNGFLEEPPSGLEGAGGGGDLGRVLKCLEAGAVLTLFYQKKSQRPERRTFQLRLKSRQIVWSRTPEKLEGDGGCRAGGRAGEDSGPCLARLGVHGAASLRGPRSRLPGCPLAWHAHRVAPGTLAARVGCRERRLRKGKQSAWGDEGPWHRVVCRPLGRALPTVVLLGWVATAGLLRT